MTPLLKAASAGELTDVERLLKIGGANVNASTSTAVSTAYIAGTTPLHIAADICDVLLARLLLRHGAAVDQRDYRGRTALSIAAAKEATRMVELLCYHGADVQLPEVHFKQTALHVAALNGNIVIIEALCACGANINAVDARMDTPFCLTIRHGHLQPALLLLELNAIVKISDDFHGWRQQSGQIAQEVKLRFVQRQSKLESEREEIREETLNRIRAQYAIRLMRFAQPEIVGICLAMAPLELPPYVLLWIMDFLPNYDKLSHHKKIELIITVRNSIWKLKK